MSTDRDGSFEFGSFRLDATERRLACDGRPVPLTPKAFQTLVVLVKNGGHVLGKDELIKEVWPDTFVDDGGLARNISALRKALGDDPSGQRFIETVPKRGYRFVGEVKRLAPSNEIAKTTELPPPVGGPPAGQTLPHTRRRFWALVSIGLLFVTTAALGLLSLPDSSALNETQASARLIAVLPFQTWGVKEEEDYLGLGIADAVITRLSHVKHITVRPTSAISRYVHRGVNPLAAARELRVNTLVEGKILRVGDRIRVTVQLLATPQGEILWAGTFDEDFRDIFSVEDAVSQRVADVLRVTLTGTERRRLIRHETNSAEAYDAYLNGRYLASQRTPEMLLKAVTRFQQASERDPGFALAYSGLADCYALLGVYHALPANEAFPKAKASAARALEIDDSISEAHTTLAFVKTHFDWDWSGGDAAFQRAIELSPSYATAHHWYAINLMSTGRVDESIAQILRAQELDPLSPIISTDVAEMFYWAGQYDRAIDQARKTLELHPHYHMAHGLLGWAYAQNGQLRKALFEFRTTEAAADEPGTRVGIGYVAALENNKVEARQILNELKNLSNTRYVSPHHFAVMYAALGEADQAFEFLDKAFETRVVQLNWLKMDPRFRHLHPDPRFKHLLKRLSLE